MTNADGNYAVPDLPVSTCTVRAEEQRLKTLVRSDLVLKACSEVYVNLRMDVGTVVQQATGRAAQRPSSHECVLRANL